MSRDGSGEHLRLLSLSLGLLALPVGEAEAQLRQTLGLLDGKLLALKLGLAELLVRRRQVPVDLGEGLPAGEQASSCSCRAVRVEWPCCVRRATVPRLSSVT